MRGLVGAAIAAGVAGQIGPAATWLPPVRRVLVPRLSGVGAQGQVALSFDDGPHPEATPLVLDELDRLGWRATFFVLGTAARAHPDLVAETHRRGHEIALHGDEHRYLIARGPRAAFVDLQRVYHTVGEQAGVVPRWWRPPYGVISGPSLLAARRLGVRPVLWSAWGRDWRADATGESVVADLRRGRIDGGTLLLHDSDVTSAPGAWRSALAALPLLGELLEAAALRVVTVGEHLRS